MPDDNRSRLQRLLESGEASLHQLTFPQRELWEAAALDPGDPANSICCRMDIRGLFTERDAHTALQRVVDRHETMRMSIIPGKRGPLQLVRSSGKPNMEFRDVKQASAREIDEITDAFFARPHKLVVGPLYRVLILRRESDRNLILFSIHHAIGDGWSWSIFAQDLLSAYLQVLIGEDAPLPALAQTYTAWGAADRKYWTAERLAPLELFWKDHLAGSQRLWDVPISGEAYRRQTTMIEADRAARLRELVQQQGATLYSTTLAAFQLAFANWADTQDVMVGSPNANRRHTNARETIGSFAIMVPIRNQIDPGTTFSEFLSRTHALTVDCFEHAMPFVELAKLSPIPAEEGLHPVYEVRFALQNQRVPNFSTPTLSAEFAIQSSGTPRYQLACELTEIGEALELVWIYNSELFEPSSIKQLDSMFHKTVDAVCASADIGLAALMGENDAGT